MRKLINKIIFMTLILGFSVTDAKGGKEEMRKVLQETSMK